MTGSGNIPLPVVVGAGGLLGITGYNPLVGRQEASPSNPNILPNPQGVESIPPPVMWETLVDRIWEGDLPQMHYQYHDMRV